MKKLGNNGRMWLKTFHLFFAAAWIGGALAMLFLPLGNIFITDGKYSQAFNFAIRIINVYVTIPAAIGSILTGFLFALFTNWGFFKHKWLTVKWILTTTAILIGAFWVGPLINDMLRLSMKKDFARTANDIYLAYETQFFILHGTQILLILYIIYVSVFKPWKKKTAK